MCSRDAALWIALVFLTGCGYQRHAPPVVSQDSCVGVADGGFTYPITGRLVDAASGEPVCCVQVDLEGHVGSDAPGFPALGRIITDNDGAFETELHTRIAWGTCIRDDGN